VRVDLQDGFEHDAVTVRINGAVVVEEPDATTKTQISLAKLGETRQIDAAAAQVEVSVASRSLREDRLLQLNGDTYIGVSLMDGRIVLRTSNEDHGYV
jgi:hypothetical protein